MIRENHETGERSLYLLKWGLVPSWNSDPAGGPKPINAMAETIRLKPMFRRAYGKRRCIVPVDGFFEWQATKGGKQPYAIAMKTGRHLVLRAFGKIGKTQRAGLSPL